MSNVRTPDVVTVAVSRVDGGVTILRVITAEYRPATEEEKKAGLGPRVVHAKYEPSAERVESLIAQYVRDGAWTGGQLPLSWRFVPNDFADEQTDRYFRNAWKDAPGRNKPDVDMPKAREIHRDKLRVLRSPLLEELDSAYMRADEDGDQQRKREVAAKKKALRDVTADPRIEEAKTPEELKALIPEALRG